MTTQAHATTKRPARAPKAHQLAKQVAKQQAKEEHNSPISDLSSRATTQSATQGRADMKTGQSVNYSGQYLYDRFVAGASTEDIAKMDIVRQMAKSIDFDTFKKNVGEMVTIAKTYDEREKSAFSAARLKTAQNHQSVMRNVYGALRLLPDQLAAAGVDANTGYHVINTVAKRILDEAGIKWDGTKKIAPEERQAVAATKREAKALAEMMSQHPKQPNESREAYYARIDKLVDKHLKAEDAELHEEQVAKLAERFKELAGDNLKEVLALLAA